MEGLARFIQDPLVVFDLEGRVLDCNRQAKILLGTEPTRLGARLFEADEHFRMILEAASGTSEPVLGALTFRRSETEFQRLRVRALVIDRLESRLRFAVQILDTRNDQFALLSRRVKELNREIAERRATQARLEEALAHNGILYRELQHRVKNHLQMTLGLFTAARRETSKPEELAFLQRMEAKLRAVFEAQRLMYAHDSTSVQADQLLSSVSEAVASVATKDVQIDVQADPVTIPNELAFPLALIVNELLSNAFKYGTPGDTGRIVASLRSVGEDLVLQIHDTGPGFSGSESSRRSSGLGLVRGLCRQIGGRFEILSEDGTLARVSFSVGS
jgi:two-component sensor histidine kinase